MHSAAPLAELVDAPDSKSGSERSAGSIPAGGTNKGLNSQSAIDFIRQFVLLVLSGVLTKDQK